MDDPAFERTKDGPILRPEAVREVAHRIVAIDLEATGLHATSWPVQLGWAPVPDPEASRSMLVRPVPEWRPSDWDPRAELVHGLSLARLRAEGRSPAEVVEAFEADLPEGAILCADAPDYDRRWLAALYVAAGRTRVPFLQHALLVGMIARVADGSDDPEGDLTRARDVADFMRPATHRAHDDAANVAMTVSGMLRMGRSNAPRRTE